MMARRLSVSTLILRTPCLMPRWISSTGTPQVCFILPPYLLMMSCSSCGTLLEPCITRWQFGSRRWISSMRSIASTSPVGLRGELVRAVAGADGDGQRVDARLGDEPLGFVGIGEQLIVREHAFGAVAVFLLAVAVSSEPRQPSSPSTETPRGVGQLDDLPA